MAAAAGAAALLLAGPHSTRTALIAFPFCSQAHQAGLYRTPVPLFPRSLESVLVVGS